MIKNPLSQRRISKVGVQPPQPHPDRAGTAIALIVKNEASHVGEWAEFHRAAGVAHFFVYDDGCTDRTIDVLRAVLPENTLTVTPWSQRLRDARLGFELHNQVLAYAHAAANFGGAFRWMAFIDIDEFLVPMQGDTLDQALAPLEHVRNLSLPWHMFGTCGHKTRPEGGIVPNYLYRSRDPMSGDAGVRAFKCIADPCHLTALRVHSVESDGRGGTWNDQGQKATQKDRNKPGFYSTQAVQLNHYYTRSLEELENKINRGPNMRWKTAEYRRKVMRTVANIEKDTVEDNVALEFYKRVVLPRRAR